MLTNTSRRIGMRNFCCFLPSIAAFALLSWLAGGLCLAFGLSEQVMQNKTMHQLCLERPTTQRNLFAVHGLPEVPPTVAVLDRASLRLLLACSINDGNSSVVLHFIGRLISHFFLPFLPCRCFLFAPGAHRQRFATTARA